MAERWTPSVLESVAQSRRIINAVIEHACPTHDAPAGRPCWVIYPSTRRYREQRGVCNDRIERWRKVQRAVSKSPHRPRKKRGYLDPSVILLEHRHPNRHPITRPKGER